MSVDGTWKVTFAGPTGAQELDLVLVAEGSVLTGSIGNPLMGVTAPIEGGEVDGNMVRWTAVITEPIEVVTNYTTVVDGDDISGEVSIQGMGEFTMKGVRA